ncbi:MAG TPA: NAD(P)/FAD-dependent oxidoreductase [Clostridia bacterium]|nr:NAD(P)/FAD-dependent oxidoreductase [Clostridia bacterium]
MSDTVKKYDIIVIGAGVVGGLIARSLSFYDADICLVDKHMDSAMGASGANSGIVHGGYDAKPGSLKARFNILGTSMMEETCKMLGVPYKNTGSLVIAFGSDDEKELDRLYENGIAGGIEGLELIDGEEARKLEPALNPTVTKALWSKTAGVVSPYKLNISAVENAVVNGVDFLRETMVTGITREENGFLVTTDKGPLTARVVINCAGIYADEISAMAGDGFFNLTPRKGEYLLMDRSEGGLVSRVIFQPPSEKGKGVLVMTTVDGNLLIGPDANIAESKEDNSTHASSLEYVYQTALKTCSKIRLDKVITSFAGLRATPDTGDFIIGESSKVPGFYNVAGIESPGLSSAPAIAEHVADEVGKMLGGLELKEKYTKTIDSHEFFRDMTIEEKENAIRENPGHGRIVCRCENVTEAEVIESIRRPAGARTVDGVKRRTRAGMGRCQGGFCLPTVIDILSRELDVDKEEILKGDGGSYILAGRNR